ncbi:MAG: hypothetical protein ABIR58_09370, partial [Gemmatimonadaceae bacterium]
MKTRLISMALAAGLSGCDQFVGPTEGYGDLDIFVPVRNNVQLTPPLARRSESIGEQQWPNDVASEYQTAASAYMLIWAYFESPGPDEFYTRAWVQQDFAYTGTDASTKLSLRLSHVGNNSAGTTLSSENAASNLFPFPERNLRDSLWTTVQDECGTTVSGSGFGNSSIQ